jgi:hypothetical protein
MPAAPRDRDEFPVSRSGRSALRSLPDPPPFAKTVRAERAGGMGGWMSQHARIM